MNIYPKLSYKPIGQCEPGELVRFDEISQRKSEEPLLTYYWAFITMCQEKKHRLEVLSYCPTDTLGPYPLVYIIDEPNDTNEEEPEYVLSYGKNWRIEIDMKDAANINQIKSCYSQSSGTLVLKNDQYLLYVKSRSGLSTYYINLTSGESSEWPEGPVATFRKWSLAVYVGGDDPFQTLVSFPVETEE